MTECSLRTSQASTAADKTSANLCSMSLVQSQCRLDLVQHHLPIRFGRETSNKLSVIKLQKNAFLHWCQQQSFKSLLTHCGVQLRLHQRHLRKTVLVSAFVMVSTVCLVSCLLFFCSRALWSRRHYRVAQKSKPLPIFQKIVLKLANEIRFLRKVKVWIKHYNTIRW